jgi:hypothetical protein
MVKHVLPDKLFRFAVLLQSIHQEFYALQRTYFIDDRRVTDEFANEPRRCRDANPKTLCTLYEEKLRTSRSTKNTFNSFLGAVFF